MIATGSQVVIRELAPDDDLDAFGRIVLDSYLALPGHPRGADYEAELVDIAERVRTSRVYGALDAGRPLGSVTFVRGPDDPHAEDLRAHEASFRMLGVSPLAQGLGVGTALVRRCLLAAEEEGKSAVFIYSGDWMHAAHRMYDRLGFQRVRDRDWTLEIPPVTLLGFVKTLRDPV